MFHNVSLRTLHANKIFKNFFFISCFSGLSIAPKSHILLVDYNFKTRSQGPDTIGCYLPNVSFSGKNFWISSFGAFSETNRKRYRRSIKFRKKVDTWPWAFRYVLFTICKLGKLQLVNSMQLPNCESRKRFQKSF